MKNTKCLKIITRSVKKKSFIEKSLLAKNGSNWEGGGVTEYKKHEF